jgi:LysM repeat protein
MKIPNPFNKKQKKLQAATRAMSKRAVEEYEEPNMRLSSAFIVVLMLHVVAVGGIYAFNSIKAHQTSSAAPVAETEPVKPAPIEANPAPAPVPVLSQAREEAVSKPADHKLPETSVKPGVRDSGQVYTVAKGDNPVTIAKRLGVGYDELLKLNKIEDPKKLQIGQKLHLPPKIKSN